MRVEAGGPSVSCAHSPAPYSTKRCAHLDLDTPQMVEVRKEIRRIGTIYFIVVVKVHQSYGMESSNCHKHSAILVCLRKIT